MGDMIRLESIKCSCGNTIISYKDEVVTCGKCLNEMVIFHFDESYTNEDKSNIKEQYNMTAEIFKENDIDMTEIEIMKMVKRNYYKAGVRC